MWTSFCRNSFLLCCLVGIAGCGSAKPEKVYQSWSSAVKAGNFPGVWECLSPTARGTVLQIMVMDADLLSGSNPGAKDAFGQVFSKYGLNPQDPTFAQSRLQVAKSSEYAADLNNVFRQFQNDLGKLEESRYHKLNAIWNASAQANLGPAQKQGTRATAAVQGKIPHTADNASVQAVFEKVNGKWLFAELEESAGGAAVAGGPGGSGMPGAGGPAMPGAGEPGMPGAGGPGMMPNANAGAGGPPGAQVAMAPNPGTLPGGAGPGPAGPAGALPGRIDPKAMPANPGGTLPAGGAGADAKAMPGGVPAGPAGALPGGDPKAMLKNPGADPKMAAPSGEAAPKAGNEKAMAKAEAGAGAGAAAENAGGNPGGAANVGAGGQRPQGDAGGNNQNRLKPGTWQYAVLTFAEKVAAGDTSGLDYVVSSKAKGLLAEIRDGELSPEKLDELKASFAEAAPQMESIKNTGGSIIIDLKGKLGHILTLTVGKEGRDFKVRDLKISEPGATKKR
jgi:hypothetical protein